MRVASELLASLFYIELASVPTFYSPVDTCIINIRCRIAPGQGLRELVYKLHRENIRLFYRGQKLRFSEVFLCPKEVLQAIERGGPFYRQVTIEASPETTIQAKIDGMDGEKHNISGCPYNVDDLICNQGLDCHFGWRSYSQGLIASRIMDNTLPEIERLVCMLDEC